MMTGGRPEPSWGQFLFFPSFAEDTRRPRTSGYDWLTDSLADRATTTGCIIVARHYVRTEGSPSSLHPPNGEPAPSFVLRPCGLVSSCCDRSVILLGLFLVERREKISRDLSIWGRTLPRRISCEFLLLLPLLAVLRALVSSCPR